MDWAESHGLLTGRDPNLDSMRFILTEICNRLPKGRFKPVYINVDEEREDWVACPRIVLATNSSEEFRDRAYDEERLKTFHDVICGTDGKGNRTTLKPGWYPFARL